MSQQVMSLVEKSSLKTEVAEVRVGDTVDVHCRILEGDKERVQIFNGLVIARAGVRETFTVRRIVAGEGVERKFPIHSPRIAKVEVKRSGVDPPAKLYYLRDRTGKAVRLERPHHGGKKAGTAQSSAVRRWKWSLLAQREIKPAAAVGQDSSPLKTSLTNASGYDCGGGRSIATRSVSEGVAGGLPIVARSVSDVVPAPFSRRMFTRPLEIPSSAFRPRASRRPAPRCQ